MKFMNFSAGNPSRALAAAAAITSLFTIVLLIVGITGMTSDKSPSNKLYFGQANLTRVKVPKVMPLTENIVQFTAMALESNKMTDEEVFGALEAFSHTDALKPLLDLYITSKAGNDFTKTLVALDALSPMAGSGDPGDTKEVEVISGVLDDSKSKNLTYSSLKTLVTTSLELHDDENANKGTEILGHILENSTKPAESVEGAGLLSKIDEKGRAKLTDFSLVFQASTDVPGTAQDLTVIAEGRNRKVLESALGTLEAKLGDYKEILGSVSTSTEDNDDKKIINALLGVLSKVNVTGSTNETSTLAPTYNALSKLPELSDDEISGVVGLIKIFGNTKTPKETLQLLFELQALPQNPKQPILLSSLHTILVNSDNNTFALLSIKELREAGANATKAAAVPHLFELGDNSLDTPKTFSSLVKLGEEGRKVLDVFRGAMKVLDAAAKSGVTWRNETQLQDLGSRFLANFDVPGSFRIGIFNLGAYRVNGTTLYFSPSKVVRGFDYRAVFYERLEASKLEPYIKALNIKPEDLVLEGKLMHREHMYLPSISMLFAFDIIALITSFLLILSLLAYILGISNDTVGIAWINRVLALGSVAGALLAASIISLTIGLIKEGADADDYGVDFTHGPAYFGVSWSGTAAAILTFLFTWYPFFSNKNAGSVNIEEGLGSNSEDDFEKDRALRSHTSGR